MKKNILILTNNFTLVFLFLSCTSNSFFYGKTDLHGIIYDEYQRGQQECKIKIVSDLLDFYQETMSDIEGKFILKNIPAGKYKIFVSKNNFEKYQQEFFVTDKRQLLIIKLKSFEYVCKEIENKILKKDYSNFDLCIKHLSKIKQSPIIDMYECIYLYDNKKNEELKKQLKKLINKYQTIKAFNDFYYLIQEDIDK